jgi:hypothetical protein
MQYNQIYYPGYVQARVKWYWERAPEIAPMARNPLPSCRISMIVTRSSAFNCSHRFSHFFPSQHPNLSLVLRLIIERAQYRSVATRCDKLKRNLEGMVAMACGYLWLPM